MNIDQAIYGRRSTREYTTEAVDEAVIGRLINAAVQAPSAVNQQPWTYYAIKHCWIEFRAKRRLTCSRRCPQGASPGTS